MYKCIKSQIWPLIENLLNNKEKVEIAKDEVREQIFGIITGSTSILLAMRNTCKNTNISNRIGGSITKIMMFWIYFDVR